MHGVYVIASALVQQVVGGEEKQRDGQEAEHRAELVGEILGETGWVRQVVQSNRKKLTGKPSVCVFCDWCLFPASARAALANLTKSI